MASPFYAEAKTALMLSKHTLEIPPLLSPSCTDLFFLAFVISCIFL